MLSVTILYWGVYPMFTAAFSVKCVILLKFVKKKPKCEESLNLIK
jgi:hypothetical protein